MSVVKNIPDKLVIPIAFQRLISILNRYNNNSSLNYGLNINSWRKEFITEILILFLCIKGRINFLQLGRFGKHKEQRYRQQFEKDYIISGWLKNVPKYNEEPV